MIVDGVEVDVPNPPSDQVRVWYGAVGGLQDDQLTGLEKSQALSLPDDVEWFASEAEANNHLVTSTKPVPDFGPNSLIVAWIFAKETNKPSVTPNRVFFCEKLEDVPFLRGRLVLLSITPVGLDDKPKSRVQLAASSSSAEGFFRDRQGRVHPIESGGGGEAGASGQPWHAQLSPTERQSISELWTGGQFRNMQSAIDGKPIKGVSDEGNRGWQQAAQEFVSAVMKAPVHNGDIHRGVGNLNDKQFQKIVGARHLATQRWTAATKLHTAVTTGQVGNGNVIQGGLNKHSVGFVIQGDHGGHDISDVSKHPEEQEVVLPPSRHFNVVGVHVENRPSNGPKSQHAVLTLRAADQPPKGKPTRL